MYFIFRFLKIQNKFINSLPLTPVISLTGYFYGLTFGRIYHSCKYVTTSGILVVVCSGIVYLYNILKP